MECGDLARTGVAGLERGFVINIDHHPGNTGYGQINWFDASAAACGEMVFDLVSALGVPLTPEIATHIYLAILTDTGSFHYSSISPRTFDICRDALEAGVDPVRVARNVYDSNNDGAPEAVRRGAERDADRSRAGASRSLYLDHEMARAAGGTYEDTEGLINLPLTVKEIQAVVFFKQSKDDEYRVSMRSKGDDRRQRRRQGVRRRRPQERRRLHRRSGRLDALRQLFVEKVSGTIGWTGSSSSTSRPARPRTTSSRACGACSASGASATPARSTRPRPACCRSSLGRATRLARS